MVCYGWLLDASFQAALSPAANMLRFQDHFHLYPIRGSDGHSLHTVFGRRVERSRLPRAPHDTALRRNIANYYRGGGRLLGHGGGIWKALID